MANPTKKVGGKASIALGLATLAYLVVNPLQDRSPWFALLASGLVAAMVGGIADWFAVQALFRRPLGIPWRTQILIRNRKKITDALVDLVQDRLLTRSVLEEALRDLKIPALLIDYVDRRGGKQAVLQFVEMLVTDVMERTDVTNLTSLLEDLIRRQSRKMNLVPLLVQAARWSMDRSYGDRAITFALGEVERLAKSTTTLRMLEDLIESARTAYKGGSIARSVVLLFLESSEEWASEAQEWVVELCREMKQPDHPTRQALTRSLLEYLNQLETNRALEQRVESIVQGWLQSGSVALALK